MPKAHHLVWAGIIASSSGSDNAAPSPRNTCRRDNCPNALITESPVGVSILIDHHHRRVPEAQGFLTLGPHAANCNSSATASTCSTATWSS